VRHVPDGVLRRLDDEPLAVPDRVGDHVAECTRCRTRRAEIADDTEHAARLLSAPQLAADSDLAWARLERELLRRTREGSVRRTRPTPTRWHRARFRGVSLRAGLAIAAVGIVVAGTAAAATLTTIFAPTHVAPLSVSRSDVGAIAEFIGLGNGSGLGGFQGSSGSRPVRFGTIRWATTGTAHPVSSLADASAAAGFSVSLPTRLPAGVGAVQQFIVQPRVRASVAFNSTAGPLAGSSVTLKAGPAVLADYAASGSGFPALAVVTMPRPTALSTGAGMSQIEAFLLRQPGVPPGLAEEIRLLGDLRTTLPVPVPSGASVHSVQVNGWPGVLLADASNAAAAVVWEDGRAMLHVVAGILDSQDVLNVARQLG
jgi:hypothetical protein